MRDIISYSATPLQDGFVNFTYCTRGPTYTFTTKNWQEAINFLLDVPDRSEFAFTVCFSLFDFTKALFSLLPSEEQKRIESGEDRIFYEDCKIFYVNGRYLGLTANIPVDRSANQYRKHELNLQALKWWVSEEDDEPKDARAVWELGTKIVGVLDGMGFMPTKLTSPVAVFADSFLGDARKYPTIFSWPEDKHEAMSYAEELMRYEWRSAYQVGYFPSTHLYDKVSAYPSVIANLPSTDNCRCEHSDTFPEWAQWGVMYGEVEVNTDVSPLVFDMGDGERINPKGKWKGYFTTGEIKWLDKWKAGHFKLEDGWFFRFDEGRPYRQAISWLYNYKQSDDPFLSTIAKRMSNGLSGKLDEDRVDGKKGDFYNPVLACIVRSHCRIQVADFIYKSKLQDTTIAVLVDSVLSTKCAVLPDNNNGIGSWRYEGELPAIVLSKGGIWRPGKRPQGISYEALQKAFEVSPESAYYEFTLPSGTVRSIDLLVDGNNLDREFVDYPECGGDVLNKVSQSKAIVLS